MARKPKPAAEIVEVQVNQETFSNAVAALNAEGEAAQAARENALALASDLGYEGEMTVTSLENEIRFYQRRSVEAVLELGKRLLLLKELTQHGEFTKRIEGLGMGADLSRRIMAATLKFSKRESNRVLEAAGTQSKLLELVVLDDAEIEALESGESVRGVTLDKIETMSVRELKAALRESKADLEASREAVARRDEKVRSLEEELNKKRLTLIPPDEAGEQIRSEASRIAYTAEAEIRGNLRLAFQELEKHAEENHLSHEDFMSGIVCQIEQALNQLRGEFGIKDAPDGSEVPAWLRGTEEA